MLLLVQSFHWRASELRQRLSFSLFAVRWLSLVEVFCLFNRDERLWASDKLVGLDWLGWPGICFGLQLSWALWFLFDLITFFPLDSRTNFTLPLKVFVLYGILRCFSTSIFCLMSIFCLSFNYGLWHMFIDNNFCFKVLIDCWCRLKMNAFLDYKLI